MTKLVCPDALDIVGLATETGINTEPRSEDALNLDTRYWTEEMEAQARAAQEKSGLLINLTMFRDKVSEFPLPRADDVVLPGRNPRNKPCRCGSGKKYKRCHSRSIPHAVKTCLRAQSRQGDRTCRQPLTPGRQRSDPLRSE